MIVCYWCGKAIKGKVTTTNPPIYLIRLGVDFPKSYHPKCYEIAEQEAEKKLNKG